MRELTADLFVTVDGWAKGTESPAYFGYDGPELQAWIAEQTARPHVILMGANTYRALAEYGAGDPGPKVVFSKTLRPPLAWSDTTLVAEDAAVAVPAMKAESGDPMRVIGSLSLVRGLIRLGLLDRLRLMVFPLVLGATGAERLLDGLPDVELRLESSTVLDERLVLLDYGVFPTG